MILDQLFLSSSAVDCALIKTRSLWPFVTVHSELEGGECSVFVEEPAPFGSIAPNPTMPLQKRGRLSDGLLLLKCPTVYCVAIISTFADWLTTLTVSGVNAKDFDSTLIV